MALSDMEVFNTYFMPATIETLAQMVDKFNAASAGSIQLTTQGFDGDFLQRSFYAALHSAQRRVDRYATNTSASATDLTQVKESGVKIAGGFGPIRFEPSQLTWLRKPTAEGVEVISRNVAEAILSDQLNTAIMALVAAIEAQAPATYDVSDDSPAAAISYSAVNSAHALFGDSSGLIIANVMTGSVFHRLIGSNIANTNNLYQGRNVNVVDLLGRTIVVTDAPALFETVSGDDDLEKVLGLVDGAAIVYDGGDVISNVETTNGSQRIETTLQVDYTFGLALKGYTWDEQNGGKSPNNTELATGSNWDKTATSIKHTAGVIAVGSADV